MPKGLKRYYGHHYLHFLTCTCYHRQPWLATAHRGRVAHPLRFLQRVGPSQLRIAEDFDFDILPIPQAAGGWPILCAFCKGWDIPLSLAHKHKRRRPEGLRRCFFHSIYSGYQTGQGKCVIFGELIFPAESMI